MLTDWPNYFINRINRGVDAKIENAGLHSSIAFISSTAQSLYEDPNG